MKIILKMKIINIMMIIILKMKTNNFKNKYNITSNFILFVGRFNKVKGIDVLLHAIKILKDKPELRDVSFVIMGVDFGFQEEMYEMIKKLDLDKKILVIKKK